jgi:hypothetical protein
MRFDWNDNEFEELLKREANQHRMYPSDKVWRNIRSEVHGYKRWHSLYISAFLIITALAVSTFLNNKPVYLQKLLSQNKTAVVNEQSNVVTTDYFKLNSAVTINQETFNKASILTESNNIPENIIAADKTNINSFPQSPVELASRTAIDLTPVISIQASAVNTAEEDASQQKEILDDNSNNKATTDVKLIPEEADNSDNYIKDFGFNVSYKALKKNKWSFQYFFAPSISYRKLNDQIVQDLSPMFTSNNSITTAAAPSTSNTLIRNRPGMGIEAGIALMYNVSNRIRFKVGLQYNLRQYYIETYQSSNDFANILLMENNRVQQNLRVNSRFNNKSGFLETEINNRIGQVSVPLGIQWDVIKSKTINFTAEATIQPSFTTSKNLYLLSTDYTNYVEGTNLMRRSNINTSVGFFASFPVGKSTIWQVGPQYRYQHLPTYTDRYPIKENLHDFGIRLGVIKSLGK